MVTKILLFIAIGVVLFELIEHIVFPLAWLAFRKRRASLSGLESMIGKGVEVREWHAGEGRVFVQGELWRAVSSDDFSAGDEAVVESASGLVLHIKGSHHAKLTKG